MNFVNYSNNRFQEVILSQKDGFTLRKDAEAEALMFCLKAVRLTLRTLYIPKVLAVFVLVNLKIMSEPKAALDNAKADAEVSAKIVQETTAKVLAMTKAGANEKA